jgi:hypothetical protein
MFLRALAENLFDLFCVCGEKIDRVTKIFCRTRQPRVKRREMRGLFTLLAVVFGITGVVQFLLGMIYSSLFIIPSFITFVNGFAWYLVGELWDTVHYLTGEVYELKKENKK